MRPEFKRAHAAPIIKLDPSGQFQEGIEKAAQLIVSGGLVAYPTESFYGLGADPTSERAIARLFSVKGRDPNRPILILVPSLEILQIYVTGIPPLARRLMEAFWPGALTLVFQASPKVPDLLTAGSGKVGIRLSSHPVATALAQAAGVPITGTSANVSGQTPCRSATEVLHSLGDALDLILDGGNTPGEAGSTILDVTVEPPRVLREGMVTRAQLSKVVPFA